jgi:hypothetical protein
MATYELITGPFAEEIVEGETQLLSSDFTDLDEDMKCRIRDFAEDQIGKKYLLINGGTDYAYKGGTGYPLNMNEIKEDYEASWESVELKTQEKP